MSLRPYRNRRDASEASIVAALRKAGATVHLIDRPVDALVLYRRKVHLLEFKSGKGKMTPAQQAFMRKWPVVVIRTPEAAIAFLNGDNP